jgi:hypothetical protein
MAVQVPHNNYNQTASVSADSNIWRVGRTLGNAWQGGEFHITAPADGARGSFTLTWDTPQDIYSLGMWSQIGLLHGANDIYVYTSTDGTNFSKEPVLTALPASWTSGNTTTDMQYFEGRYWPVDLEGVKAIKVEYTCTVRQWGNFGVIKEFQAFGRPSN